ncbi:hypothetical protein D3C73_1099350 [compost metagenome]
MFDFHAGVWDDLTVDVKDLDVFQPNDGAADVLHLNARGQDQAHQVFAVVVGEVQQNSGFTVHAEAQVQCIQGLVGDVEQGLHGSGLLGQQLDALLRDRLVLLSKVFLQLLQAGSQNVAFTDHAHCKRREVGAITHGNVRRIKDRTGRPADVVLMRRVVRFAARVLDQVAFVFSVFTLRGVPTTVGVVVATGHGLPKHNLRADVRLFHGRSLPGWNRRGSSSRSVCADRGTPDRNGLETLYRPPVWVRMPTVDQAAHRREGSQM